MFPRGKWPAAPFRHPAGYCPAWGCARKSRLCRNPCREASRTAPPAYGKGALSASAVPSADPGTLCSPPCHLILPLQLMPAALATAWLCCPSPKPGDILPQLPAPLLLVRWDGLDAGSSFCLHPAPNQRARPDNGTCRLPTMCQLPWGPHDVQTPRGSLRWANCPWAAVGWAARGMAGWI